MKVEVVRSRRRRKTVQARAVNGVLRVAIPADMSRAEEEHWVAEMVRRMERRRAQDRVGLAERARLLSDRYQLRPPAHIAWSDRQAWRWGSCTPSAGTIRISSRLAQEPTWVLDYVVVHELAHLDVAGHDARFWALVGRYPLTERARGFLIARDLAFAEGLGLDPTAGVAEATWDDEQDEDEDRAAAPGPAYVREPYHPAQLAFAQPRPAAHR